MSLASQMKKKKEEKREKKNKDKYSPPYHPPAPPIIKLCIGLPTTGTLTADTAYSLGGLMFVLGHTRAILPMITKTIGMMVSVARNQIVLEAQRQKMDRLLFIDSDMVFPHDAYLRLSQYMEIDGVDVIGCNYSKRNGSGLSTGIGLDKKRLTGEVDEKNGIIEVAGLGCGFLLIDMKVFDKLEKPYFKHIYLPGKEDDPIPGKRMLSEDLYFCNIVRGAGMKVWCDTALSRQVGHVGSTVHFLPQSLAEPPPQVEKFE